jgi:2-polyprenyl-6-methoxyphenol hydroxylase-like FAD-dependent oxidoreductase
VNLAFEDSMKLADAILRTSSPSTQELDDSIRAFESDMFSRAKKTSQLTCDMKDIMFVAEGGPRENIESYLLRAVRDEFGWMVTMGIVAPLVYVYYFVFRCFW